MDLKTYLHGLDVQEREAFARRCGTSIGHLKNVAYGYKPASESLAINVDRESGGKVPVEVLRPDVDWEYLRSRPVERRTATS